jgi:hypothetical protein
MSSKTQRKGRAAIAWLTLTAMLGYLAPPIATAEPDRASAAGTIQLCTAYGFRSVSVPASDVPPGGPVPARAQHCSHCCCAAALSRFTGGTMPACGPSGRVRVAAAAAPFVATEIFVIPDARAPPPRTGA